MEVKQMVEEKKEVKDRYVLTEIVTQKDVVIADTVTEEVFSDKGLLVEILNKLDRIERSIA